MRIRWGKHQRVSPLYHAIDVDKRDGNPFTICGKLLLDADATEFDHEPGISRKDKCTKCLREIRVRTNRKTRSQS